MGHQEDLSTPSPVPEDASAEASDVLAEDGIHPIQYLFEVAENSHRRVPETFLRVGQQYQQLLMQSFLRQSN